MLVVERSRLAQVGQSRRLALDALTEIQIQMRELELARGFAPAYLTCDLLLEHTVDCHTFEHI